MVLPPMNPADTLKMSRAWSRVWAVAEDGSTRAATRSRAGVFIVVPPGDGVRPPGSDPAPRGCPRLPVRARRHRAEPLLVARRCGDESPHRARPAPESHRTAETHPRCP